MNIDLRIIVRLLFVIILASLISTIILGNQIHKRIIDSIVNQKYLEFHKAELPTSLLSQKDIKQEIGISLPIITLSQRELDILKTLPSGRFRLPNQKAIKDWHDIKQSTIKTGLGKQNMAGETPQAEEKEDAEMLYGFHGFNAKLSDRISLNRCLPEVRPLSCCQRKYLKNLPNVTVVMSFYNEHLSVLLRSISSIVNRSPPELLKEIILVDDASNFPELGQKLEDFIELNFSKIVRILRLKERRGLIKARVEGAKLSSCRVLVFLDSHIEVNVNWLPPLLEPIAVNQNIVTGPILDTISHKTFEYMKTSMLTRSGFNWLLQVKQLPAFSESMGSMPYRTPLLVGAMAIDRNNFWILGGYDEDLDIWGGEQFEMSFKVWMCGGMLLYIPCSRVGHINRGPTPPRSSPRNYNFLARNYKRVAEVWMDEYKKYVYERNRDLYDKTQPGFLTRVRGRKMQLNCKSFDWYMNKVAPDFLKKYPTEIEPSMLIGPIESVAFPGFCVDALNQKHINPVVLSRCIGNATNPGEYQNWYLSQEKEIRLLRGDDHECLEAQGKKSKSVWLFHCHDNGGNQYWIYNRKTRWIQQGQIWVWCLEAAFPKGQDGKVGKVLSNNVCDKSNRKQQWKFGEVDAYDPQTQYQGA
ncbi:putative polypeptide N-acetylgalactosaminyltransferase 10 [Drosophila ficusphila]|uniref:putative polypeptide N-acetylgalactosaminyltransferase 10 n=1 Tax=Drosophila ficusphila TaxID=30025 RepID=UPI0007E7EB76|nr:putative polypeptide N-acetylgalactosaminyltransferase 10 [Drosophila ficusphila]